ncbi:para-nitrobenzyl esterase-like isoform X2 [Pecten maximus]|uniref:para-nitrobenzyl esterase-like isoform X2 n=1 Tax=Pecten maximus TaxID=6579 RepID=UPI0014580D7B|nr:para-nitrobenzyl esterase-like isoform X2 [Pecten maximus]
MYLFWCLCGALLHDVTFGFIFGDGHSSQGPRDVLAQTSCGPVRGKFDGNAYAYKGIPYAVPPIRTQRWQPPEPLTHDAGTCWPGTFDASVLKSQCVQRRGDSVVGTEDCLHLNVWTPTNVTSANLSVMVFIHGGSLEIGNGDRPGYAPNEQLARDTNIVYVSMNYRLQAFGFMALDILSQNSKTNTSGNYGHMDQILALKWVQENIRNFGGDPSKVTLFGQSSGGTSVMVLLASPLAKGLFQKAWMLSASPLLTKTSVGANIDNIVFLKNTNCSNITCLLHMSAHDVTQAVPWNEYPFWAMADQVDLPVRAQLDGGLAIVDGYVLKETPLDAWVNGRSNDVPLIIGTTAQETDFVGIPNELMNKSTYDAYVLRKLGSFGTDIAKMALRLYPLGKESIRHQFTSMVSDVRVGCGNDIVALWAAVNTDSPVYRYVVTSVPSVPVRAFGIGSETALSFHGWDGYAFFGTLPEIMVHPSHNDIMFEANIRREIMSFVETGSPYSKDWLPFPESVVLLSDNTKVTSGYHSYQCDFWMQNGFFDYSWVN